MANRELYAVFTVLMELRVPIDDEKGEMQALIDFAEELGGEVREQDVGYNTPEELGWRKMAEQARSHIEEQFLNGKPSAVSVNALHWTEPESLEVEWEV